MSEDLHILSLTGGGFKGLYSARILEMLENESGKKINQLFDLIAGTSIGGIIALAASYGIPMADVVKLFKDNGTEIFPSNIRSGKVSNFFQAKYDKTPLEKLLVNFFKEEEMHDLACPTVIPALNMSSGKIKVFKSPHLKDYTYDKNIPIKDVALATSAAPTFFPMHVVKNMKYVDGGLFANAPDLVGYHEATRFMQTSPKNIKMLSIGALTSKISIPNSKCLNKGFKFWLAPKDGKIKLIETLLGSQQQLHVQIIEHILSDNRYLRVDDELSTDELANIDMDKASETATEQILGFAERSFHEKLQTMISMGLLHHNPKKVAMFK